MASRRPPRATVPCAAAPFFPAHDHLDRTNEMTGKWHEDHCREASARPRTRRSASISRPSPCERKSKGSPRLHTAPQRHRLDRTRTAAQERGQKKKRELPLPGQPNPDYLQPASLSPQRCRKSTPTRRAAPPPGRRPRSLPVARIILRGAWPPLPPDVRCSYP